MRAADRADGMVPTPLEARWLLARGVDPENIPGLAGRARARVARYTSLHRWGHRLARAAVRFLGPVLCLGRPGPADRLAVGDFERLEERLADFPWMPLRLAYYLFRLPLLEQWLPEEEPTAPDPGPSFAAPSRSPSADFDVVVVGSGAGGAPLAWELSRRGARVAVVEAGVPVRPASAADVLERHYLEQGMLVSATSPFFPVLAGCAVGGTTAINSGTCLRPHPERLAVWDQIAGTKLAGGELDPWLDEAERLLGVAVPPRERLGASARLFETGLARLGRSGSFVLPRNAPACQGLGRCCFGCPSGAKRGTDVAFLLPARAAGCEVLSGARALQVRLLAHRVEVVVRIGGATRVLACREVVLAGGALGTPALVRRGRLGDRWRLAGDGLRVHPAVKIFAHFPGVVGGERGVPQGLGYHAPELPRVTFEGVFTPRSPAAKMMALGGERLCWWLDRYDHVASFGLYVRDRGVGRVRHAGDTPLLAYRMHPDDARDLGQGMLLVAEAFFAAGADRVLLPLFGLPKEPHGATDLGDLTGAQFRPGRILAGAFHPQGTAAIGRVVGPDLGLLGCPRVHVCDASVFPDSPGVNPMVTIVALSLRLARRLAERLGLGDP